MTPCASITAWPTLDARVGAHVQQQAMPEWIGVHIYNSSQLYARCAILLLHVEQLLQALVLFVHRGQAFQPRFVQHQLPAQFGILLGQSCSRGR